MKRFLVETIRENMQTMLKDTRLKPNMDGIQLLHSDDVMSAHLSPLGAGAFSQVTSVAIRGDSNENENKRYACKQLKRELLSDPQGFFKAATEIAYEAHILSSFDPPNSIKLRGLAAVGIASFGNAIDETHYEHHQCTTIYFFFRYCYNSSCRDFVHFDH